MQDKLPVLKSSLNIKEGHGLSPLTCSGGVMTYSFLHTNLLTNETGTIKKKARVKPEMVAIIGEEAFSGNRMQLIRVFPNQ